LATETVRPFWDALARGDFVLSACSECGAWQWYPFEFVRCHPDAHLEWKSVPKTGTVFTHVTVHRSFLPNATRDAPPYVAVLVELDGIVGPRIATFLVDLNGRAPEIGMRVKLKPTPRTGYVAPSFAPAE